MARAGQGSVVQVHNLADLLGDLKLFRKSLDAMAKETGREIKRKLGEIGEESTQTARGGAQGGTRQQARAAYNIESGASAQGATIFVTSGNDLPYALGASFGGKRPIFPGLPWVGNSWEVGVRGQGPYFINDAIADHADKIEDDLGDAVEAMRSARQAFPDGGTTAF